MNDMLKPRAIVRFNPVIVTGTRTRKGAVYNTYAVDLSRQVEGRICARMEGGRIGPGDSWEVQNRPAPPRAADRKYMVEYCDAESSNVIFLREDEMEVVS